MLPCFRLADYCRERVFEKGQKKSLCSITVDCVEPNVRQFDCPSVRDADVSKLLQLGNGHRNARIRPKVCIQSCHCHAGAGGSGGRRLEAATASPAHRGAG